MGLYVCPPVGARAIFNRRCNTRSRAWRHCRAFVCRVVDYSPARYEYETRLLGFGSGVGLRLDRGYPEFRVARSLTLYLREGMLGRRLCCLGWFPTYQDRYLEHSYMYHSVSAINSWMCEPCKILGDGILSFGIGPFGLIFGTAT